MSSAGIRRGPEERRVGSVPPGYHAIRRGKMAADRDFTQIANRLFRDSRLSAKAMGVFGHISTHRDGYGVTPEAISKSMRDGVSAIKGALRELEQYGYLIRVRERTADGKLRGIVYEITDEPEENRSSELVPGQAESHKARSEPADGNPPVDNPPVENRTPKNTKHKNSKSQNTTGTVVNGAAAGACAGAHAASPRAPINGHHLEGLEPKALTQKLTAVWSAVVLEHGGLLPVQDSSGWDHDGTRLERGKHPIGGVIKTWLEAHPQPGEAQLDDALTKIRDHAQAWAQEHQRSAA